MSTNKHLVALKEVCGNALSLCVNGKQHIISVYVYVYPSMHLFLQTMSAIA